MSGCLLLLVSYKHPRHGGSDMLPLHRSGGGRVVDKGECLYRIKPILQETEPMTDIEKRQCPACHGNGYVRDADGERTFYRDCEVCDSQGEIPRKEPSDD